MMKVWISKCSQIENNRELYESTIGVFDSKEKAVQAAFAEIPAEASPFKESVSNDIYVRYVGKNGWSVVADCWEVL